MASIFDVSTEDNLQYQFFPNGSGLVQFKVKTSNDAHIALTTGPQESEPIYEIIIGGWGNTKSVIRKNKTKPAKVEIETPDIVNGDEFRGFWVRWDGGVVSAGREGEVIPFISWTDPEPFPIGYVGVCTGWGASGSWKIKGSLAWVEATSGQVPPGAVPGGQESTGEALYVARAEHSDAMLPGKLVSSHGYAYVSWGGKELKKNEYQVLVGGANWVQASGSNIPPGAFPGGKSESGETLYVGRVHHKGSLTTGKVQPSHGVCYISFASQELGYSEYEILTH